MPIEKIVSKMNEYALYEYKNSILAKCGVAETLKKLKENNADLNILTASPHTMLDCCLERLGIYDIFTNVWSCDDFNTTKGDPAIYKMAADRMKKPVGEILFLDDNYNACKTAKTAGVKVCGVYDPSSDEYVEDIKSISDYYIFNFSELLELSL
jgi:HAD superfamily hydrolase (TIGR01509 family)